MKEPIRSETFTKYSVEYFGSEQGEMFWIKVLLTEDYDEALVKFNELKNAIDNPVMLISNTTNIDVLDEVQ